MEWEQEKTWSLRRRPNLQVTENQTQSNSKALKKKKPKNKREQAQINGSLSVERQPPKNVSQSSYRVASSDTPDEESLTNDLTIGWRVLACILISLLAIGLWVAHFACFFLEDSRASITLYCPPVSCVGCCHRELWSRSCPVSESPCRFPLSVAISCRKRRKVHSGQFERVKNTFSIDN